MTSQEKPIIRKQSLLELAEYLQNISQACKINGAFRQHFYDIKRTYDEHGLEGVREKSRRKPCIKSRVAFEVEKTVANVVYKWPAFGQTQVVNELHKREILVSGGGVRSIWMRRLSLLQEKQTKLRGEFLHTGSAKR